MFSNLLLFKFNTQTDEYFKIVSESDVSRQNTIPFHRVLQSAFGDMNVIFISYPMKHIIFDLQLNDQNWTAAVLMKQTNLKFSRIVVYPRFNRIFFRKNISLEFST